MTVYGPGAPKYGRGGRPLSRKKPLRAKPHSKGNRAEREVIDLLHAAGWTSARRNFQSGGQGGGDILNGPTDYHLEVKHRERAEIWKWLAQAEARGASHRYAGSDLPPQSFKVVGGDSFRRSAGASER